MGDYIPETSDEIFSKGRSKDSGLDDLQVWKRQLKEQEAAVSDDKNVVRQQAPNHSETLSDSLDDIQRFKLKLKEEQESRSRDPDSVLVLAAAADGPSPTTLAEIPNELLPPVDLAKRQLDPPSSEFALKSSSHLTLDTVRPTVDSPIPGSSNQRVILETQSPLSVAGIDAEYNFARFAAISQSPINQDTSPNFIKPFSNGKLTPTPAAPLGPNVSGTSPSQYAVERTDSPGSSTSPAPQSAGKGSRFAKFWDNRSKDPMATAPTPSPASSMNIGSFSGPWNAGPPDVRSSRPQPQPVPNVSGSKMLDGLLQHMSMNDPHPTTNRNLPPPVPSKSDADRMQNLLSMLNPSQVSTPITTIDGFDALPRFRCLIHLEGPTGLTATSGRQRKNFHSIRHSRVTLRTRRSQT